MKIDVIDTKGQKKSEAELSDTIFNSPIKMHLVHDVVRYQLAKRRKGCAATKNRSAVRGGGIKPWRQKGTGRARSGSIRSPLWVGGGVVFGPHPRDFSLKINKKVKKAALMSALSLKVQNNELILIDDLDLPIGKTKLAVEIFKDLGLYDKSKCEKLLIIVDNGHENLKQASRNIPNLKVMDVIGLNVYDILWHHKLVITQNAITRVEELLAS